MLHLHKVTGIGGSEHHLLALLPRLDPARFATHLLMLEEPARPAERFRAKVQGASIAHGTVPIYADIDPGLPFRLARTFSAQRPHIVHTHLLHADLYGLTAARLAGVHAAVSTKHNDDPFRRGFLGRIDGAVSRLADRVIVISDHLGRFYREVEAIPAERITRIHYGLDPGDQTENDLRQPAEAERDDAPSPPRSDRGATSVFRREFGLSGDTPLLGVVARLEEQKGHRVLLEALPWVRAEFPNARVLFAGSGTQEAALRRRVGELGLADAVIFAGFRDDVDLVMSALDLFVLPSLWEGFGLVLLEAMRAGRAIVASAVSAIPEIVEHGRTGLLVPSSDPPRLADAILALLRDPDRRAAMGAAGRMRLAESFSLEAMVRATEAVYEDVARRRIGR